MGGPDPIGSIFFPVFQLPGSSIDDAVSARIHRASSSIASIASCRILRVWVNAAHTFAGIRTRRAALGSFRQDQPPSSYVSEICFKNFTRKKREHVVLRPMRSARSPYDSDCSSSSPDNLRTRGYNAWSGHIQSLLNSLLLVASATMPSTSVHSSGIPVFTGCMRAMT